MSEHSGSDIPVVLRKLEIADQMNVAYEQRIRQLESEVTALRRYLWLTHGHPLHAMYGDDGEMQCELCLAPYQLYDWKRNPVDRLIEIHRDMRTLPDCPVCKGTGVESSEVTRPCDACGRRGKLHTYEPKPTT